MKQPKITRLQQLLEVIAADDGGAFLLTLSTKGGRQVFIEIESTMLSVMISALLRCSQVGGERAPQKQTLKDTEPSQTVSIPSEEFVTRSTPAGGLWLMFRAGSVDLSVALPDPKSSQALAHALLNPS